jgi:hypothetical protein
MEQSNIELWLRRGSDGLPWFWIGTHGEYDKIVGT